MRAAIYARVSTYEQEPENQLQELRRYTEARGWTAVEYVDRGVSGAKDKRPALDALLKDAKRRRFDVLVCWRLDRLGRNLRPLVALAQNPPHFGVAFVSLGVHVGDHCLIVALGIAADGQKHALGLWDGSTENATVCQGLLATLQSRGLRPH